MTPDKTEFDYLHDELKEEEKKSEMKISENESEYSKGSKHSKHDETKSINVS